MWFVKHNCPLVAIYLPYLIAALIKLQVVGIDLNRLHRIQDEIVMPCPLKMVLPVRLPPLVVFGQTLRKPLKILFSFWGVSWYVPPLGITSVLIRCLRV